MSIVEWAQVILPIVALLVGVPLAWRHRVDIDRWVARLFAEGDASCKS